MESRKNAATQIVFEEKSTAFERLVMLCDGIFAIAMTLLVLDIKLPEGAADGSSAQFTADLFNLLLKSAFYALTFAIVASYWVGHRRLMTYVKRQDRLFTTLTFVFLVFIVFFPVSFNVIVASGKFPQAVIFYTCVLIGCSLSSFFLWAYASWKHRLIDPTVSSHEIVTRSIGILISPVYYCLSLLLLLIPNIEPYMVFYSWAFIPVFVRIIHSIRDQSDKQHQRSQEIPAESDSPIIAE
ncbi:hypothetical protein KDA_35290 [Dictyobacter alpinus]|uniref:DUF1211 domain-containing membrane protein n=1 Tax=Dictyobacter alpinus TaxID=2014873 RepID=A0A402B9M7_9CHLR|nr:TMEM175 family protein [Dictyobacter alpinus]GCE28045.1 hypothetical protein KDA_35290 [Dictyobacter alpinus]